MGTSTIDMRTQAASGDRCKPAGTPIRTSPLSLGPNVRGSRATKVRESRAGRLRRVLPLQGDRVARSGKGASWVVPRSAGKARFVPATWTSVPFFVPEIGRTTQGDALPGRDDREN